MHRVLSSTQNVMCATITIQAYEKKVILTVSALCTNCTVYRHSICFDSTVASSQHPDTDTIHISSAHARAHMLLNQLIALIIVYMSERSICNAISLNSFAFSVISCDFVRIRNLFCLAKLQSMNGYLLYVFRVIFTCASHDVHFNYSIC